MKRLIIFAMVLAWGMATCQAQQAVWHHWRGPNQNGAVDVGNPPTEWGLDKNIVWKAPIPGNGSSTPIVTEDQVIIMTAVKEGAAAESNQSADQQQESDRRQRQGAEEGQRRRGQGGQGGGGRERGGRGGFGRGDAPTENYQFFVISFDRATGAQKWKTMVAEEVPHEGTHVTGNFAPSSPITDGKFIYVDYGSRGIFCLDMEGNVKWEQQLGKMQIRYSFGEGASAALAGDRLIVPWDHEGDSFIAALSTDSGEVLWKVDREEATTWATPLVVEHKGVTQVIASGTRVRSYNAQDGSLIWECGGQVGNPVPTPILNGDHVICMTGYRGNAIASISLDSEGDVTDTPMVSWTNNDAAPYVPSAVMYGGQLYLNQTNDGIVTSLNADSGEVIIPRQRLRGLSTLYSSPVAVNGHVYFTGRDGVTVVFKHGADLEIVATNSLEETVDSSLAIVGDQIFIRGENHLFCIGNSE